MAKVVRARPEVQQALSYAAGLLIRRQEALTKAEASVGQLAQWQVAHPLRAKLHALGWHCRAADELAETEAKQKAEAKNLAVQIHTAGLSVKRTVEAAKHTVEAEQAPMRARLRELGVIHRTKAEAERIEEQRLAEREVLVETFTKHAGRREIKAYGYGDSGKRWAALPPRLRKMIEGYNGGNQEDRGKELDKLRTNDGQEFLASVIPVCDRTQDRAGPSLKR